MDVSIVGAGGEVGRALATHLLSGALIGPSERLQLVGHVTRAESVSCLQNAAIFSTLSMRAHPQLRSRASLMRSAATFVIAAGATLVGSRTHRLM